MASAEYISISDILTEIAKLQDIEKDKITRLDKAISVPGFNPEKDEIVELIADINQISESRQALFNTIADKANVLQASVADSRVDLVAQLTLLKVIENELNDAKATLEALQIRNETKIRLVQINTYYGKRYESQSNLMKKIIFVCVPVLILLILKKKSLVPDLISKYLIGIILAIGGFLIIRDIWDIFTRSNMNFDEYEWKYQQPDAKFPSIWQYNKDNFFRLGKNPFQHLFANLGTCVADACCAEGMTFDEETQKCVMPLKPKKVTQGFTTKHGLTGSVIANYNGDDDDSGIKPFMETYTYATV
jgi:hypothetical protein